METFTFSGLIDIRDYGESPDVLILVDHDECLAEELEECMAHRNVSVRYWITDKQCSKEEATDAFLRTLYGDADVKFSVAYSEITGYLWTNEWIKVGGHDLLAELASHKGKWLILEVDVHE